jgi:hypothetical protein
MGQSDAGTIIVSLNRGGMVHNVCLLLDISQNNFPFRCVPLIIRLLGFPQFPPMQILSLSSISIPTSPLLPLTSTTSPFNINSKNVSCFTEMQTAAETENQPDKLVIFSKMDVLAIGDTASKFWIDVYNGNYVATLPGSSVPSQSTFNIILMTFEFPVDITYRGSRQHFDRCQ